MTETERMNAGFIYDCTKDEIMSTQTQYVHHMQEYNTLGLGHEKRMEELLKLMFAEVGEETYIQPPFYANWGGHHVHLGKCVFANFGTTFVDDGNIYIGDYVMIAPNVTIATAGHPIYPSLREQLLQYNADVHIGRNVWIGAGSVICPGVTIGENTVIGAGSIVVNDILAMLLPWEIRAELCEKLTSVTRKFTSKARRLILTLMRNTAKSKNKKRA